MRLFRLTNPLNGGFVIGLAASCIPNARIGIVPYRTVPAIPLRTMFLLRIEQRDFRFRVHDNVTASSAIPAKFPMLAKCIVIFRIH